MRQAGEGQRIARVAEGNVESLWLLDSGSSQRTYQTMETQGLTKIPRPGVNELWTVGRIWPWSACVYPTLENGFQIFKGLEKTKDM